MFPTKIAVSLAQSVELENVFKDKLLWKQQFGQYQRMCLVADETVAMSALRPYIGAALLPAHKQMLSLIYSMCKSDILSLAVEALVNTAENSRSDKDKIAAATVVNELFGEKELIKDVKLTDKLMINLVGNAS